MSGFPNEHQLTAYVLGELNADERARVEEAMRRDPAVAANVERLRKTAAYLRSTLKKDPDFRLSPDRRAALEAALRRQRAAVSGRSSWWRAITRPYVLAPVMATALVLLVVWKGETPKARSPLAEQARNIMPQGDLPPPAQGEPLPTVASSPPVESFAEEKRAEERTYAQPPPKPAVPLRVAEDVASGERAKKLAPVPQEEALSRSAAQAGASKALGALGAGSMRASTERYDVRIVLADFLGSPQDAVRISSRVAAKLNAMPPEKARKAELGLENEDAVREEAQAATVRGKAVPREGGCEITIVVTDVRTGESKFAKRQETNCALEALGKAFEEMALEAVRAAAEK